jgi:hypothetical protein
MSVTEALLQLQVEAAQYPDAVRTWMMVMAASFFAGVLFTPWYHGARWVVVIMLATAAGLVVAKMFLPEVSRADSGTFIHLALWPFALLSLWICRPAAGPALRTRVYVAWSLWVSLLMLVSLAMDAFRFARMVLG